MKKIIGMIMITFITFGLVACGDNTPIDDPDDDPVIEEPVDPDVEDPTPVYNTTFNRPHASYYEVGVPLIEDAHIVYMNFDGFAKYYYDELVNEAMGKYTPTLKKIIDEGIKFENLRNALPSITNPCQNMIITGSTSAVTKNVYRYYDKTQNIVIQQERDNANKTIIDVALENDLTVASVLQYLAHQLSPTNPDRLYVNADLTNPKVVERNVGNDHFARFEQLSKLLRGQEVNTSISSKVTVTKLPRLTLFYADDLDSIGHNEKPAYGYTRALSEAGRMENIMKLLKEMDTKLGDFLEECKQAGIYDKLTFFLTTDHGMTPFGATSSSDSSDARLSKLGDLKGFLKSYNNKYNLDMVAAGNVPGGSVSVVGVGANLNLQLTFKNGITDEELDALKIELKKQNYIYDVFTRNDLAEQGYWVNDTDMIITPAENYCFSGSALGQYIARGQHDSSQDSSSRIYGAIWGKGIKKGYVYEGNAFNYDFGTTMAACLGIEIPGANGVVLDIFER